MFLTYDAYKAMGGTLDEATFTQQERKARAFINLCTHQRIANEDPVRQSVQNATFDLIGLQMQEAANDTNVMLGVTSSSNDGVSVHYQNWATMREMWKRRKMDVLVEYLMDEYVVVNGEVVTLLYRGVEYDRIECDGI